MSRNIYSSLLGGLHASDHMSLNEGLLVHTF